jgi:protein-S-isoprenylcysteine O-methyltransferase Ste14
MLRAVPYHGLELKVPPVAVGILTAALMRAAAWAVPRLGFTLPGRPYVAGGVALAGALVAILGVVSFKRAKTTVNPMKPESSSTLVVSGIYRVTRNPMYLGFLLILLGWGAWLSNALSIALVAAFVLYMDLFQIRPEERALESRFGPEFVAYKGRVRRWV